MQKRFDIPWEKLYDYTLECGSEHDPATFMRTALDEIGELVPFDQGVAIYLDENRNVCDRYLVNMKNRWINMYIEYYSHLSDVQWNMRTSAANERFDLPYVRQILWDEQPITEFIANYIMARGVKCTLSFVLFDQNSLPRATFSLDRTQRSHFTEREIDIVRYAAAPLGNLFKNFFTDPASIPGARKAHDIALVDALLTKREREVVDLLTQGLSPAHVAKTLHISVSTTYKHIAHIYKKLNVSSQQELLVRVLGSR